MSNLNNQSAARFITIASGKGGVGKTNVSVNLAIALALYHKEKVLIIDGDIGLANINILLGMQPKLTLNDVLKGSHKMNDVIIKTDYYIHFLAGLSAFYHSFDKNLNTKSSVFEELFTLNDWNTIIIDLGAGISDDVMRFIFFSSQVLIVINPEPTSITDAYSLIKKIGQSSDKFKIQFLLNRVQSQHEADKISSRLIKVAQDFLHLDIQYLGFIFEDPKVKEAIIQQKPFLIEYPNTKASKCIKNISNVLALYHKNKEPSYSINDIKENIKFFLNKWIEKK